MAIEAKRYRDEVLKAAVEGDAMSAMSTGETLDLSAISRWETLGLDGEEITSATVLEQFNAWLAHETKNWNNPVAVRTYKQDQGWLVDLDAKLLLANGYELQSQSSTGSHVNIGRTVTGAALTGGLSLLLGGSRSRGTITLLYLKKAAKPRAKGKKRA